MNNGDSDFNELIDKYFPTNSQEDDIDIEMESEIKTTQEKKPLNKKNEDDDPFYDVPRFQLISLLSEKSNESMIRLSILSLLLCYIFYVRSYFGFLPGISFSGIVPISILGFFAIAIICFVFILLIAGGATHFASLMIPNKNRLIWNLLISVFALGVIIMILTVNHPD